jgi:hypothetical protein
MPMKSGTEAVGAVPDDVGQIARSSTRETNHGHSRRPGIGNERTLMHCTLRHGAAFPRESTRICARPTEPEPAMSGGGGLQWAWLLG